MSGNHSSHRPIAFFDFDDTLFCGDSVLYWLRYYYRHRPLRRWYMVVHWAGILLTGLRLMRGHQLKKLFFVPLAFEKPEYMDKLAVDFVREELLPRCYPETWTRLWCHHALGHQVVIISASATFYLKHLQKHLPDCTLIGTEVSFPSKGLWRWPRYRYGNVKEANKITLIEKQIPEASQASLTYGYSDSHTDLPLLRYTKVPVVVQPDAKLHREAVRNKWEEIYPAGRESRWKKSLSKLMPLLFLTGGREAGSFAEAAPGGGESGNLTAAGPGSQETRRGLGVPPGGRPPERLEGASLVAILSGARRVLGDNWDRGVPVLWNPKDPLSLKAEIEKNLNSGGGDIRLDKSGSGWAFRPLDG